MKFPVFCAGIRPLDSKGRGLVTDYDIPIQCGGVTVNPGDVIFADFDGVVVVPKEVESEIFHRAKDKVESENHSRRELQNGRSLREVYNKYKSL